MVKADGGATTALLADGSAVTAGKSLPPLNIGASAGELTGGSNPAASGVLRPEAALDPASCVRCNTCVSLCPTYAEDPAEGMNPRGRLALLRGLANGDLAPSRRLDDRIFSCMLCGACASLCPREMDVPSVIYEARDRLFGNRAGRRLMGYGMRFALGSAPAVFKTLRALRGLGALLPLKEIGPFRALQGLDISLSPSPLREGPSIYRAPRPKGRVALFAGCTVTYVYPDMGAALIRALNAVGYDVVLPKGEVCCGAPLLSLGLKSEAAAMMEKNVALYGALEVEAVLSPCPTCAAFITKESERLTGAGIENTREVSRFLLAEPAFPQQVRSPRALSRDLKVLYHDPCHTLYHHKVREEPRKIIRSLGYTLIEPRNRGCCGFGGTFRVFCHGMSEEIARKRVEDYHEADVIVTSCPNCVLQFRARMRDRQVMHIAEFITGRRENESRP